MDNELLERYKDYNEILDNSIHMPVPNSSILIYEGVFILKHEKIEIKVNGNIQYDWFPLSGAVFVGVCEKNADEVFSIFNDNNVFELIVGGLKFGDSLITKININSNKISIKGSMIREAIHGDHSVAVEKIIFSVPNFRDFHGLPVKRLSGNLISILSNRLVLDDDLFTIKIDKIYNYPEIKNQLDEKGGYQILCNGEITSKKGSISYKEVHDVIESLNLYLSFLNGRRTSVMFAKGIFKNETIWTDFTDFYVDLYEFSHSWPSKKSVDGLNEVWKALRKYDTDENDKDFLATAIHWYIEANKGSGFIEGSLIMSQTALELIYNWYIVENKKMLSGKDSENINASNKIRLLLSQINLNLKIPEKFTSLKAFVDKKNNNIIDAPDGIVQIRNAVVHSQEEKRKKLKDIPYRARHEALQLCIWYIEMSLLKILNYNFVYLNRCSIEMVESKRQEYVPWSKQ